MARQYGNGYVEIPTETESKWKKKIKNIIPCVFIGIGICAGIYATYNVSTYSDKMDAIKVLYDERYAEWSELSKKFESDDSDANIEYVDAIISSAKEDGLKVCDLQNNLIKCSQYEDDNKLDVPTEEHVNTLSELRTFIPNSTGTNDLARNSWTDFGEWRFESTYDYKGNAVPVVWTCYSNDTYGNERLIAVVTAKYNSTEKVFNEVALYYTSWYNTIQNDMQDLTDNQDVESPTDADSVSDNDATESSESPEDETTETPADTTEEGVTENEE